MAARQTGLTALALAIIDQGLKAWLKDANQVLIPGVLDLQGIRNTGVSFGLLAGHPEIVAWLTLILVLGAAIFLRQHPLRRLGALGAGLMLGGALGNLLDRLVYGAVVDYLKLTFIDFPVFNLADAGIILGAGLIVMVALLDKEERAT